MKLMKYFWPPREGDGKGPHIPIWINSSNSELHWTSTLDFLVSFPLIQSTLLWKSEKSRELRTPSFTSCSNLFLEACPNLLCQSIEDFSLIQACLGVEEKVVSTEKLRREDTNAESRCSLYKPSIRLHELITSELFIKGKSEFLKLKQNPTESNQETEIKLRLIDDT